jgi:tetratricopeptide (TPR) repeat protein
MCLRRDPRRPEIYGVIGEVALLRGRDRLAVKALRRALQIDPARVGAANLLARGLLSLGEPEEAIALLEKQMETPASGAERYYLLGQAYQQLNDYGKAKQNYEASIKIASDLDAAYYGLANVCARLGQKDKAAEHLETFRELRSRGKREREDRDRVFDDLDSMCRSVAVTYADAGRVHQIHGDLQKAKEYWQRAAELDPQNRACRVGLVSLFRRSGQLREALRVCEQLMALEPRNPETFLNVGKVHLQLGRFELAETAFKQAIQLAPQSPEGYYALALLYLQFRRKLPEAAGAVSRAVELDPGNVKYRQVLKLVKQQRHDYGSDR